MLWFSSALQYSSTSSSSSDTELVHKNQQLTFPNALISSNTNLINYCTHNINSAMMVVPSYIETSEQEMFISFEDDCDDELSCATFSEEEEEILGRVKDINDALECSHRATRWESGDPLTLNSSSHTRSRFTTFATCSKSGRSTRRSSTATSSNTRRTRLRKSFSSLPTDKLSTSTGLSQLPRFKRSFSHSCVHSCCDAGSIPTNAPEEPAANAVEVQVQVQVQVQVERVSIPGQKRCVSCPPKRPQRSYSPMRSRSGH
jgi:hypothetical protein